ncbi:MAG: excinuclease ABC subunit UvrC [Clostridiales bacterium]|nr:MAG: excinuclease ABC subunit UvrC [Clostridiales bacterium]
MEFPKKVTDKLAVLTTRPGVYLMKDREGRIIYVGKAKNLKNRVSSYFTGVKSHTAKVLAMVRKVADFDYICVNSEMEALILENNLIKRHSPKYNILLKDDKTYPFVALNLHEPYPHLQVLRQESKEGCRLFGPFPQMGAAAEIVRTVNDLFGLATCGRVFPRDFKKGRPCLRFHIGNCCGVCTGQVSRAQYRERLEEATAFLKGDYKGLTAALSAKMEAAAEALQFEKAAALRDRIRRIEKLGQNQIVDHENGPDRDILDASRLGELLAVGVLVFRGGRLLMQDTVVFREGLEENWAGPFIQRYYRRPEQIPREILLPFPPEDTELLEAWLSDLRGGPVTLRCPQRGRGMELLALCRKNASEKLAEREAGGDRTLKTALLLAQALGLPAPPQRIEMYDISNFGSDSMVGGMIVWEGGRFRRSAYRKFKIRDLAGPDDYAATRQMLARRLAHLDDAEFGGRPDLILMDGGAQHLNAVRDLCGEIPLFGLVKDRRHRTRGLVSAAGELDLRSDPALYAFFSSLQEEVHRFAITYMKKTHSRAMTRSPLLELPGMGPARLAKLKKAFPGGLPEASAAEIRSRAGLPEALAEAVYRYYHGEDA